MGTINVNLGVPNSYIVLYDHTLDTSTQVLTDAGGSYSFINLDLGDYSVYNTAIDTTGQNPPTVCGFPEGYNGTKYPRRQDTTIDSPTRTRTLTFDFDRPTPWSDAFGGSPPPYGLTTLGGVNLIDGSAVAIPSIGSNGIGYSIKDNMIYGRCARNRSDGAGVTVTLNPSVDLSNGSNVNVGDCDFDGRLIFPTFLGNCNQMSAICVDPLNLLYLRPVTIYGGFEEKFSPYYEEFSPAQTTTADQAFVPSINSIVWVASSLARFVSLDTSVSYSTPITGQSISSSAGICFADMKNFYCPTGSRIFKMEVTTTTANGSYIGNSSFGTVGDASRAANMPLTFAIPELTKTVDKELAAVGDELIYTVTIVNTGITDGLTNYFVDTIPDETTFITDSIYVDGVQQVGATPNFIDLGSLVIGELRTVTFRVLGEPTTPNYTARNKASLQTTIYDETTELFYTNEYNSNTVNTTFVTPYLNISKAVDLTKGNVGDVLKYTLEINNISTITANSVIITDTTPEGSTFVADSLIIDGTVVASQDLMPPGYSMGDILGNELRTITFEVEIASIPDSFKIDNTAGIQYIYEFTPTTTVPLEATSNLVSTDLSLARFDNIQKYVDKEFETNGGIIEYTIAFTNTGNVDGNNIVFIDTIPNGTSYVAGSLTINGAPSGETFPSISIGTVAPNKTVTVVYRVQVD